MVYIPFTALRCPMQNRKHHKERNCHHHTTSQRTELHCRTKHCAENEKLRGRESTSGTESTLSSRKSEWCRAHRHGFIEVGIAVGTQCTPPHSPLACSARCRRNSCRRWHQQAIPFRDPSKFLRSCTALLLGDAVCCPVAELV